MAMTSTEPTAEGQVTVVDTNLKAGALALPSIFMQAMSQISPGIAALFYTPFVVANAGLAAPLAYPIGFVIVLMTVVAFAELARAVPSAGGYYTYVARGIHPRAGFLVAWANMLYTPIVVGSVLIFGGYVWATSLGWPLWWPLAFLVLGAAFIAGLQYRGVQLSGKVLVVFGSIELIVVLALGVWGILNPGPGGFNFKPFIPSNAASLAGLALAGVFAIQAFSGWEGATPMAEEATNPRRTVPLALFGSVILFGIFIVIVQWGVMLGWGTDQYQGMTAAGIELPGITLAKQFWGEAWVILLIMLMSSTIAVSIACANVTTRMLYRMSLDGLLPKWLSHVHPRFKTPTHTIITQFIVAVAWGFSITAVASLVNPGDSSLGTAESNQFYIYGTGSAFAVIFIYIMVNVACFLLYWRQRRQEFKPLLHLVFPAVSTIGMLAVTWVSLSPLPAVPYVYAIPVTFGWVLVGIGILVYLRGAHRDDWMLKAVNAAEERPATPEEIEGMRGEW